MVVHVVQKAHGGISRTCVMGFLHVNEAIEPEYEVAWKDSLSKASALALVNTRTDERFELTRALQLRALESLYLMEEGKKFAPTFRRICG